jgi:hypothetical protein
VTQTTLYFDPVARYLIRSYALMTGVLGTALAFDHFPAYSGLTGSTAVVFRVGAGALVVWSFVGWRIGGRAGVETGPEGITVWRRFGIRGRFVPWSEITTFRIARQSLSPVVCAQLGSGGLVRMALVQGRKMRWRGGASRDIVGVLNGYLPREGRPA